MSEQDKNKQGQINIELDEKTAEGIYSNLAIINHSVSEFVVDFISIMPGTPKAKVKSRIILTPQHAKRFLKALHDNVNRFEKAHGEIKVMSNLLFRSISGQQVKLKIRSAAYFMQRFFSILGYSTESHESPYSIF